MSSKTALLRCCTIIRPSGEMMSLSKLPSGSPVMIKTYIFSSVIVTLGNACAYLFQLVAARGLSSAEFGAVSALLNLSFFIIAPFASAPFAIAKLIIDHGSSPARMSGLVRQIVVMAGLIASGIFLFFWGLSGFWAQQLQLDGPIASLMFPLLVASTFLCYLPIGIWQAERSHMAMSIGMASVPILRLAAIVVFVSLIGMGLTGAMLALIMSCLLMVAGAMVSQRHYWSGHAEPPAAGVYRDIASFVGTASFGSFCLLTMTYMDVPLMRALVTPEQSGLYAAASTLAKIALLLPSSLINIVFPEAASLSKQGEAGKSESRRLILLALAFTVVSSGGCAAVMAFAPVLCLQLLGGGIYEQAAPLLQYLGPAMSCMAVVSLVVTYAMACNRMILLWPCLLSIAFLTGFAIFASLSVDQMALLVCVVFACLSAICVFWLLVFSAKRQ